MSQTVRTVSVVPIEVNGQPVLFKFVHEVTHMGRMFAKVIFVDEKGREIVGGGPTVPVPRPPNVEAKLAAQKALKAVRRAARRAARP